MVKLHIFNNIIQKNIFSSLYYSDDKKLIHQEKKI